MSGNVEHFHPRSVAPRSAVLALVSIVFSYAMFNAALFAGNVERLPEFVGLMLAGSFGAQPLLLGMWASLGPGAFMLRLPVTIVALYFVIFSTSLLPTDQKYVARRELILLCAIAGTMVFALAIVLGAVARLWSRQSIQFSCQSSRKTEPIRFSLKYVLGLTTFAAVPLAMIGGLMSRQSELIGTSSSMPPILEIALPATFLFASCLPTVVILWGALSLLPRAPFAVLGVVFWIALTIVVVVTLNAINGPDENFKAVINIQFGAAVIALGTGLAMRASGFRLLVNDDQPSGSRSA